MFNTINDLIIFNNITLAHYQRSTLKRKPINDLISIQQYYVSTLSKMCRPGCEAVTKQVPHIYLFVDIYLHSGGK